VGWPIVSTSANPSGRSPARNELKARGYFQRQVDYVLPGETLHRHGPSRIRTLSGESLRGGG
jgi:L-threonylcarbamoyladenylate synthase